MKIYRNKLFVNFIIIGIFLAFMVGFFIVPSIQQILDMNNEISQQRLDLEKKSSLGLNIRQIKTDLKSTEQDIGQLDSFFVKPGKELDFISAVETLGNQYNVKININPQFPGQDINARMKMIPLIISTSGSRGQVNKFLKGLEAIPYYYNIDSITENGSAENTSLQITGQIYSLK